jgi:hypothetical protein
VQRACPTSSRAGRTPPKRGHRGGRRSQPWRARGGESLVGGQRRAGRQDGSLKLALHSLAVRREPLSS